MKNFKRLLSFAMLVVMLFVMATTSFATENGINPRFNNLDTTEAVFVINDSGKATVSFTCYGYIGITTRIVVETKIEKKFLWWWNDVDGASWTDETTEYCCDREHYIQLTKSGTYRASITYTVYGTAGEADVITRTIENSY